MTTVVIDNQRSVTVNDQGAITRVTVAQAGVQGPQGDPTTVNGKTGATITLTASDVGAIATSARGAVNGVAELDSSGLVPLGELPVADLAGDFMDLSTNQTAATGIKTFSVSPVVPTPTTGGQAANKSYADLMLPLTGGTMSGVLAMGSHKITGLTNGGSAQDGAAFGQLPSATNLLPLGSGGTGQATAQLAMDALAGAVTSGDFLRGNGTHVVMAALSSGDIPNNAANTSGTAAGLSATLAIASGGTGQTTASAAYGALSPMTTLGDIEYRGASVATRLAGNATAAKQFLTQTGTGTVSAAPVWAAIALASDVTGQLPVANGGTGSATQNFVDLTTAQAAIAGAKTFTGLLTGSARIRATSTGASTGTGGFMGQTAGGPPASGTFVVGDFIVDGVNGTTWICITAGTPGTWMPAGAVPLGTKILAANAASISINVPTYVNHIMGFFSGRQDSGSGGAYCKMQFNTDTGTHYDWQLVQGTVSTASSSNAGAAVAFMQFGVIPGSGDTTNYFGNANFTISNVQSAVFKPMRSSFGGITSPSVGYAGEFAGLWLSTAAITSVQVLPNSGNLGPGSSLTLIGYP